MNTTQISAASPTRQRAGYDLFISYSRRDKAFVRQLFAAVEQAAHNAWVDWEDIPPTAEWRQEIYQGIEAAHNFVFVISPDSVQSQVCGEELEHAIQQGKRLIPIVYREVSYEVVHPELAKLNWIFFQATDDFETALRKLITALDTNLDYVQTHTRLLVKAKEWQGQQLDPSFLLRGKSLEAAERWLAQSAMQNPGATALHETYIQASRVAEQEHRAAELRLRRFTPQQYRNLQAVLNKVKNYWVEGVLESSLATHPLIELRLEDRAAAVASPWGVTAEVRDGPARSHPLGTRVTDIFQQMGTGRTLLILGEPGAGKTLALLGLARDLIDLAEQDIDQPIPVVFNLSSWSCKKPPIATWLVQELNTKYQVPKKIGRSWVEQQLILPLLDGLDEVSGDARGACVTAINVFHQKYGAEMVVCSRREDYEDLPERLQLQRAVYLRSLTPAQVRGYLAAEDPRREAPELRGLQTLIAQDPALQKLVESPLMLGVMIQAYQGGDLDHLSPMASVEDRRQQIFAAYVDRMFKRRGGDRRYSEAQTRRWLSRLAQQMSQMSQTVFLIEEMQSSWLPQQQQWAYGVGVRFCLGLAAGVLHLGLLSCLLAGSPGLLYGVLGGILVGILYGLGGEILSQRLTGVLARAAHGLTLGLIVGPLFGLIHSLLPGSPSGLAFGATYGLLYFVVGWILYGFLNQEIEPVERVRWSGQKAKRSAIFGIILGLVLAVTNEPIYGLLFGCILWLILSFDKGTKVEEATLPNQGIWQSAKNAALLTIVIGLVSGIALGVVETTANVMFDGNGVAFGAVNGVIFGMASGLLGGQGSGIVCIRHFVLRCLLWFYRYTPWNCARFLDYASDRIFLKEVGGNYLFIHRLLLEHFAQQELPSFPSRKTLA